MRDRMRQITPAKPDQYASFIERRVPMPDDVREGIRSVPMRMPNRYITHSFCYLIQDERGGVHVVDPGWPMPENEEALRLSLAALGSTLEDVRSVIATHLHPDHVGMTKWVVSGSGAEVILHEAEQRAVEGKAESSWSGPSDEQLDLWGVPAEVREEVASGSQQGSMPVSPPATHVVRDGDMLPIEGRQVQVIHTPGHTTGHMCLHDLASGIIFTGDHVMPTIHGGLGLGGGGGRNPLADYLASMRRIKQIGDAEVAPGHEFRFLGLNDRCDTSAQHHLRRSREVRDQLESNPRASVWEIASLLTWSAGWQNLRDFYLQSALTQTAMHIDFVRSPDAGTLAQGFGAEF